MYGHAHVYGLGLTLVSWSDVAVQTPFVQVWGFPGISGLAHLSWQESTPCFRLASPHEQRFRQLTKLAPCARLAAVSVVASPGHEV